MNTKLSRVALVTLAALFPSSYLLADSSQLLDEATSDEQTEQSQSINSPDGIESNGGENILTIVGTVSRYSATKSDTPIMETARSVSIETSESIREKGFVTLDDAYTYSAGVFGERYGYATRGDWVVVRGLDVPQYQDSLQSLFGNYNNARPDIYTLEQIEILKGPASVLYGKGSPGGIINVVSKTPKEESANELVLQLGTHNRKQIAFDSTGKLSDDGEWLYRFIGVKKESDTQVDFVEDNALVIAPSITWRATERSEYTFLINHTEVESDTAAQFLPIYGTLFAAPNGEFIEPETYTGDPGYNRYDTETTSFTLLGYHELSDFWTLELTARVTEGSADYQQAWTSFIGGTRYVYNPDGSLYGDGLVPRSFYRSDATSEQSAIDVRLRGDLQFGEVEHELLMGVQYQDVTTGSAGYYAWAVGYDATTGQPDAVFGDTFWINVFNPTYGNFPDATLTDALYNVNPDVNAKDLGVYISDQISIDNWRIMLGLRFDETETSTLGATQKDDAVSASYGALYQFANGFSPYLSYAESFDPVIGDNGNGELLKPQEGEQWELGFKYEPQSFDGFMTLAYFDIEQTNLPDPQSLPGQFEQQSGVATFKGLEFEMIADFGEIDWEINLSDIDSDNSPSVPELQGSTWLNYQPDSADWQLGVGLRHFGKRYGGAPGVEVQAETLIDFMFAYNFVNWRLSLNIRNLDDKQYFATCLARGDCFPGDGRNVVAQAIYNF